MSIFTDPQLSQLSASARRLQGPALSFAGAGVSQVLSSLSNVIISMAIARGAGASGLGAFTIAFTAYLIALGFQRLLIAEPFHALARGMDAAHDESGMVGSALVYSVGCGGIVAVAGSFLGLHYLLVLAVALPGVNLQDAVRYVAFRRDRPAIAMMVDGIWVAASILAWPIVSQASAAEAVLLWGVGGGAGALAGLWILRTPPVSPKSAIIWWRSRASDLGSPLALAGVVYTLTDHLAILGIALFVSADALGELRAGQIIVQPSLILLTVVNVVLLPRFAGTGRPSLYRRIPVRVSIFTAIGCSVILGITLLLLGPIGALLFGGGVAVLAAIVVPLAVRALTAAAAAGFGLALKADQQGKAFIGARLVAGVIGLIAILAGTALSGITGAAWGMAFQGVLYLIMLVHAWVNAGASREATI